MLHYTEFAKKIKEKYPAYKDRDDRVLAEAMIKKYPVYKDKVTFDDIDDTQQTDETQSALRDVTDLTTGFVASGINRGVGSFYEGVSKPLSWAGSIGGHFAHGMWSGVAKGAELLGKTGLIDRKWGKIIDDVADELKGEMDRFSSDVLEAGKLWNTTLTQHGEELKEQAVEDVDISGTRYEEYKKRPEKFKMKDLSDPRFWAYDVYGGILENAPVMLASLYAGSRGSNVATKVLGGTGTSLALNAGIEANQAYENTLKETGDKKKAFEASENVFKRNFTANSALELGQMALLFATGGKSKQLTPFVKHLATLGKITLAGGMESIQERIEDDIQAQALERQHEIGQTIERMFNPEISKTDIVAFIMGAMFQGLGNFAVGKGEQEVLEKVAEESLKRLGEEPSDKPVEQLGEMLEQDPDNVANTIDDVAREYKQKLDNVKNTRIQEAKIAQSEQVAEELLKQGETQEEVILKLGNEIGIDNATAVVEDVAKKLGDISDKVESDENIVSDNEGVNIHADLSEIAKLQTTEEIGTALEKLYDKKFKGRGSDQIDEAFADIHYALNNRDYEEANRIYRYALNALKENEKYTQRFEKLLKKYSDVDLNKVSDKQLGNHIKTIKRELQKTEQDTDAKYNLSRLLGDFEEEMERRKSKTDEKNGNKDKGRKEKSSSQKRENDTKKSESTTKRTKRKSDSKGVKTEKKDTKKKIVSKEKKGKAKEKDEVGNDLKKDILNAINKYDNFEDFIKNIEWRAGVPVGLEDIVNKLPAVIKYRELLEKQKKSEVIAKKALADIRKLEAKYSKKRAKDISEEQKKEIYRQYNKLHKIVKEHLDNYGGFETKTGYVKGEGKLFKDINFSLVDISKQYLKQLWDTAKGIEEKKDKAIKSVSKKIADKKLQLKSKYKGKFVTTDEALKQAKKIPFFRHLKVNEVRQILDGKGFGAYIKDKGLIEFVSNPHETTLPHEAFHAFVDLVMPQSEKQRVFEIYKKRYGLKTDNEIEERMAQDYAEWFVKRNKNLATRIVAFFKKIANKLLEFTKQHDQILSLFESTLSYDVSEKMKERIAQLEKQGGIDELRKQYQEDPIEFTSKIQQAIDAVDKKEVSYGHLKSIVAKTKKSGLKKPIEILIEHTMELPQFKDNKRIKVDEFLRELSSELLDMQIIYSDTYANYGMDNINMDYYSNSDEAPKTVIVNTNFQHGIKGHFSGDFDEVTTKDDLEIRKINAGSYEVEGQTQQVDKDQYYVVKKGLSRENLEEGVFAKFDTEEEAQEYINNFADRRVEKAGMLGHFRRTIQEYDNTACILEIQSDVFQGDVSELYRSNKRLMGEELQQITSLRNELIDIIDSLKNRYDKNHQDYVKNAIESELNRLDIDKKELEDGTFFIHKISDGVTIPLLPISGAGINNANAIDINFKKAPKQVRDIDVAIDNYLDLSNTYRELNAEQEDASEIRKALVKYNTDIANGYKALLRYIDNLDNTGIEKFVENTFLYKGKSFDENFAELKRREEEIKKKYAVEGQYFARQKQKEIDELKELSDKITTGTQILEMPKVVDLKSAKEFAEEYEDTFLKVVDMRDFIDESIAIGDKEMTFVKDTNGNTYQLVFNNYNVEHAEREYDLTKKQIEENRNTFIKVAQEIQNEIKNGYRKITKKIKELESEIKDFKLTPEQKREIALSEQFLSLKDKYHEILIKTAIRDGAINGAKKARFPTPLTVSYIENYVDVNEYGDEGRYREGEIAVGDDAETHLGDEGIVVSADSDGYEVLYVIDGRREDLNVHRVEDVIDGERGYWESEFVDSGMFDLDTFKEMVKERVDDEERLEEIEEWDEDFVRDEMEYDEFWGDIYDEVKEEMVDDWANSFDVEEFYMSLYGDNGYYAFEDENGVEYIADAGGEKLSVMEERWASEVDKDNFDLMDIQDDTYRKIAGKYGVDENGNDGIFYKYLKKTRPDLREVKDDNGFTWWETDIKPEDKDAVVMYQTADQIQEIDKEQFIKDNSIPVSIDGDFVVYHGTSAENTRRILDEGFKKGSELSEEAFRGGGYGAIQDSISFSIDHKIATNFTGTAHTGVVFKVKLKPNANIIQLNNIDYAEELDDYIDVLNEKGIDAVYLPSEKEVVVVNKDIIERIEDYKEFSVYKQDLGDFVDRAQTTKLRVLDVKTKLDTGSDNLTTQSEARKYLEEAKKRLGVDFDVVFVDNILVQGGREAYGVMVDNTIALAKNITDTTALHELGHLTLANIEKIPAFKGMTREQILRAKAKEMGVEYGNDTIKEIEEQLMLDLEKYAKTRKAPKTVVGKFIKKLFELIQKLVRAIKKEPNLIKNYYDILLFGKTVDSRMIELRNNGLVESFVKDNRLSFDFSVDTRNKDKLTDIEKSALKAVREGKSFDEWWGEQDKVYHGTLDTEFKLKGNKPLFLAEDFDEANLYAGYLYNQKPTGKVLEFVKTGGKTLDITKSEDASKVVAEITRNTELQKIYNSIPDEYQYFSEDIYDDLTLEKIYPSSNRGDFLKWLDLEYQSKPKIVDGKKVDTGYFSFNEKNKIDRQKLHEAFSAFGEVNREYIYGNWDKIIKYAKDNGYDYIKHITESPDRSIVFPEIVAVKPSKTLKTKAQLRKIWDEAQNELPKFKLKDEKQARGLKEKYNKQLVDQFKKAREDVDKFGRELATLIGINYADELRLTDDELIEILNTYNNPKAERLAEKFLRAREQSKFVSDYILKTYQILEDGDLSEVRRRLDVADKLIKTMKKNVSTSPAIRNQEVTRHTRELLKRRAYTETGATSQQTSPTTKIASKIPYTNNNINISKLKADEYTEASLLPPLTRWQRFREAIEDNNLTLKIMMKGLEKRYGDLDEAIDLYMLKDMLPRRSSYWAKWGNQKRAQFLMELKAKDISVEDFNKYLHARHAQERNAKMREVSGTDEDGLSGMTDKEAREILKKSPQKFAVMAEKLDKLIRDNLEFQLQEGLISEADYQAYKEQYKYYVPLYRDVDTSFSGIGQGVSIIGKEHKRARGNKDLRVLDPLSNVFYAMERAKIRALKNRIGQAISELVEMYPEVQKEFKVEALRYKPVFNSDGELQYLDPKYKFADNVIGFKKDGKQYLITVKNKELASALKNLNLVQSNAVLRFLRMLIQIWSSIKTRWSPEFMITNFMRDLTEALINLGVEESQLGKTAKGMKREIVKNLPSAQKEIYLHLRGKKHSEMFDEFERLGGDVGHFWGETAQSSEKSMRELEKRLRGEGIYKAIATVEEFLQYIDDLNSVIELGIRYSTYKSLIKRGVSKEKAVQAVADLTINFARQGKYSPFLKSLYGFIQPTITGASKVVRSLTHETGRKYVATRALSLVALGFIAGLLSHMLGGDDDDNIPEWAKNNTFVLALGGGKTVTLWQMPYGYNVFFSTGRAMSEYMLEKKTMGEVVSTTIKSAITSFTPIETDAGLISIVPTMLQPLFQIDANKAWYGGYIYPEQKYTRSPKPDSKVYKKHTSDLAILIADLLNKATGGSDRYAGFVDIHPNSIEYAWKQYFGGAGTFLQMTGEMVFRTARGEFNPNQTPFLRKFYREDQPFVFVYGTINDIITKAGKKKLHPIEVRRFYRALDVGVASGILEQEVVDSNIRAFVKARYNISSIEKSTEQLKKIPKEDLVRLRNTYKSKKIIKLLDDIISNK